MLFFGIASFVLPMLGMQFTMLNELSPETLNLVRMGLIGGGLAIAVLGSAIEGGASQSGAEQTGAEEW